MKKLNLSLIWGGVLAVAAALGMLGKWAYDMDKDQAVSARFQAANVLTVNAMAGDVRELRKDVNKLMRVKKRAAVDTLGTVPVREFPGVIPFVIEFFTGWGKEKRRG